ncbi:hypothetical protein [Arthrobacter sp. SX1312]|uniref:hypothetical protein n=1 Tax=Arthrobacter sp. SX1312 TaxID=2058896 RepID=UPI000CE56578|nr:hypothetical protein [Arthrobacter sp. SX1312]
MVELAVEAILDEPCPRAGITLTGLAPGEHVVSVWRTADGQRVPVRGARMVDVVDSAYWDDWEVPLGRSVSFELEVVGGPDAGVQGITGEVTVDADFGYVQDPLNPATAVRVMHRNAQGGPAVLVSGTFAKMSYASDISTFQIMGSNTPVGIGGVRQAASGVPLSMLTRGEEENLRMRDLVAGTAILVIRGLPEWGARVPASASYAAGTVTESNPLPGDQVTVWETTGDTVRGSSAKILVALWTYQDVADIFATYDQKRAAAGGRAYLEDQKNPANV